MLEPIKAAFGQFMARFYAQVVPTVPTLSEFTKRGLDKSVVMVASRMIDAAEDMLKQWQNEGHADAHTRPAKMPIMIVAFGKDTAGVSRDFGHPVADPIITEEKVGEEWKRFSLRKALIEVRAQIVIFAHDEPAAKSLASQFCLYLDELQTRWFDAQYNLPPNGAPVLFPVQIEMTDAPAMNVQTEAKNLTILAIDLSLRASVPLVTEVKV